MRRLINLLEAIEQSQISDEWFQGAEPYAKKGVPEKFQIADQDGEVRTLENPKPVPYRKGDYIMTGPKGEQYVIAPEKFQELKVDNGDGTASPKPIPKLAKLADHDGHVVVDWGSGPQNLEYRKGQDFIVRHGPGDYGVVKKDIFQQTYVEYELINHKRKPVDENFADGKKKGKSRPGRAKRAGVDCSKSITDLRKMAKNSSGEKQKMAHWCANMKSGRNKNR